MKTTKYILATLSFSAIVEELEALAKDPETTPEEAAQARRALEQIATDKAESADRRDKAAQASKRVEAKIKLDERMGVRCGPASASRSEGVHQVMQPLTPEQAKRVLSRAGR